MFCGLWVGALSQTKAKDPMQSQAAWVKRRRLEVNKIASAMPDQPAGQPPVLPAAAKKAIAKMGQVVSCLN